MTFLLLVILVAAGIFLSLLNQSTEKTEKKCTETHHAQTTNTGFRRRYRGNFETADIKDVVFDISVTLYLDKYLKGKLFDWDYTANADYNPSCLHYMQYKNYIHYITKDGKENSMYVWTKELWTCEKTMEEEVRIPMDDVQIWIAQHYLTKILPTLKTLEKEAAGNGFRFEYVPDDEIALPFMEQISERLSANTDYICTCEDGKLIFGLMAEPAF